MRSHGLVEKRLGPVRGQPFVMVGLEAMAERMADYLVGHHPGMPGVSQPAQPVAAPGRRVPALHQTSMPARAAPGENTP